MIDIALLIAVVVALTELFKQKVVESMNEAA